MKVWNQVQTSGGSINVLVYPVIENNRDSVPFVQHVVASIEGSTLSPGYYENKYGESIYNVGPQNLNLQALISENKYDELHLNSTYLDLDVKYQIGSGLKNFDVYVSPSVTGFSLGQINSALDNFDLNAGYTNNYGFIQGGECYFLSEPVFDIPQFTISSLTRRS